MAKYISVDIETTGFDPEQDQIIEFGAIVEDTLNPLPFDKIPKFHAIIKHDRYSGNAFAINMNQRIFKILADRVKIKDVGKKIKYDSKFNICNADALARDFYSFIYTYFNSGEYYNEKVVATVAGKNYASFDGQFLKHIPEWNNLFNFHNRVLDPASLYWDSAHDKTLPSLDVCLKRAGLDVIVPHDAIEDAWLVIQVLRKKYKNLATV